MELCHWLRSGKGERTEMKNILWLIKHSTVFLTSFPRKNAYGLDKDISYVITDLILMTFFDFD